VDNGSGLHWCKPHEITSEALQRIPDWDGADAQTFHAAALRSRRRMA
jgi:hypothetical protein